MDGQIGRANPFQAVQLELGNPYIYVDGHCRYWTTDSPGRGGDGFATWRAIRTGDVTTEEEDALTTLTMYDDFSTLGQGCNRGTNLIEAPVIHIFNGSSFVHCWQDTPIVAGFLGAWGDIVNPMYERGGAVPPEAGVRLEVGSYTTGPLAHVYAWPLAERLANFVVSTTDAGVSRLVTDASSVTALLALRDTYLRDEASANPWDPGIQLEGGHILYMREELPITNAIGLLPFQIQP